MFTGTTKEIDEKGSSVLIAGGSGVIGRYLTSVLLGKGFKVAHLSRRSGLFGRIRVFRWDPEKDIIDPGAFSGIDYLINLAGENIGGKRWTKKRKEAITGSRIQSTECLYKAVVTGDIPLKAYVTASAIGYYGTSDTYRVFQEEDPPGKDFTGHTCRLWEKAADLFGKSGIRVVKIRSAVVLEKNSGLLAEMNKSLPFHIIPVPGSGKQHLPWIHITDLCNIFMKAVTDNTMTGSYNAVAPEQVTWNEFAVRLRETLDKHTTHLRVPAFLLKGILGEMSGIILKGNPVSGEKLIRAGFRYEYDNLPDALKELYCNTVI